MRRLLKPYIVAAILISLSCIASCTRHTQLSVKNEIPPSFEVTGGGYELFFGVGEVTQEKNEFGRKELPVWAFKSKQRREHTSWPIIVYGKLDDEFTQTFPDRGSPISLTEGKVYGVHATIYGTPGDHLWFMVKDGKAVEVTKPE